MLKGCVTIIIFGNGRIISLDNNVLTDFSYGNIEIKYFEFKPANGDLQKKKIGYTLSLFVEDAISLVNSISGIRSFICEIFDGERYLINNCIIETSDDDYIIFEFEEYKKI